MICGDGKYLSGHYTLGLHEVPTLFLFARPSFLFTCFLLLMSFFLLRVFLFVCMVSTLFACFLGYLHGFFFVCVFSFLFAWFLFVCVFSSLFACFFFCLRVFLFVCMVSFMFSCFLFFLFVLFLCCLLLVPYRPSYIPWSPELRNKPITHGLFSAHQRWFKFNFR